MSPKKFETNAVRTQAARSQHDEHSVPLYLTSSFVFDDAEEMQIMDEAFDILGFTRTEKYDVYRISSICMLLSREVNPQRVHLIRICNLMDQFI